MCICNCICKCVIITTHQHWWRGGAPGWHTGTITPLFSFRVFFHTISSTWTELSPLKTNQSCTVRKGWQWLMRSHCEFTWERTSYLSGPHEARLQHVCLQQKVNQQFLTFLRDTTNKQWDLFLLATPISLWISPSPMYEWTGFVSPQFHWLTHALRQEKLKIPKLGVLFCPITSW